MGYRFPVAVGRAVARQPCVRIRAGVWQPMGVVAVAPAAVGLLHHHVVAGVTLA